MRSPLIQNAIRHAGTASKLAQALGVAPQAVSKWQQVPANRVLEIERITGVPRYELRPDLYPPDATRLTSAPPLMIPAPPPDKVAREAQRLFGSALRRARLQYGKETDQGAITQKDFALMLGISSERPEERYRLYETGKRDPPLWILAALRRVTGFSLDDLIAYLPAGRRLGRY